MANNNTIWFPSKVDWWLGLILLVAPAVSLVPDGIVGRDEARWPAEDVEAARAALSEAGYAEGKDFPPIGLAFNVSPQWTQLAEYLRHVERLFSPRLVIVGGGISKDAGRFLPRLAPRLRAQLAPAKLRNRAGIVGAALSAV